MSRAARLGAFMIATLGILVLGVVIIGNHQYLFSSTYQLKSQFATVAGLVGRGGCAGRWRPQRHGAGDRDCLTSQVGKLRSSWISDKSTHEIIKQDSMASIQTEGLLGNQFMSISFGSPGKTRCPRWRDDCQRSTAGDGRPAQENRRNSGQHPAGCRNAAQMTANLASISGKD